jgi:Uma2 family endonuclease
MNALLHLDLETLPATMVPGKRLSDCEFESMCAANDLIQFERTRDGAIVMNPPTAGSTSNGNVEILWQLQSWWKTHRRGKVYEANCGFFLEDGSMLIPDAAYVLPGKLKNLKKEDQAHLFRICPDFVIELLSKCDSLRKTQRKMEDWIANGAALGWLVDPYKRRVIVYSPNSKPASISSAVVHGSGPVKGFTLDLAEVWRCYED